MAESEFEHPGHCLHGRWFEDCPVEKILKIEGRAARLSSEKGFGNWGQVLDQEPVSFKTKQTGVVMYPIYLH